MDDTPHGPEAAFDAEVTRFLDANAQRRQAQEKRRWGEGVDEVGLLVERSPADELEEIQGNRAWRRLLFDAGLGWIAGPVRYGGRGLPPSFQRRYADIEVGYTVPSSFPFGIGLGMVGPTILAHGTDEVRDRYLRPLHRGDIIACQLFSEPSAGSDLAGVQTRAVRDGAEWVVTGQKVWTSGAQYSDIGEVICRTDTSAPKHRGLTAFIIDMKAAGVDVRPLRQMTGGSSFNEVFLTDVRIPDTHRLGEVNHGWSVAITTLMNERATAAGGGESAATQIELFVEMVRHFGRTTDPVIRQALADLIVHLRVADLTNARAAQALKNGGVPGPEMSVGKLARTENMRRVVGLVGSVLGPRLQADTGEWGTFSWASYTLGAPGWRLAGGTDEVMKNIIAERVLGLPKESARRDRE